MTLFAEPRINTYRKIFTCTCYVDNGAPEPGDLIYFLQYLQQAGYQTAFFGKWHMGEEDDQPLPGFDQWENFRGQGVYYNPILNINGKKIVHDDSTYITGLLTKDAIRGRHADTIEKHYGILLAIRHATQY